ncbi:sigma-70 family RNA polymerase sigma factor [Streptomyces sp. AC495_CC817]|uniref:sigma-70 family RNA polymerase sigma factor n=1 Tax=Streptomyces sp. AC495_CC817 TaxID=2823900 RepID=UPI001C27FEB6|nr:sigma-70 family RNA polymerase sigma factor [Streptomyces sp. AC495_CC817]
MPMPVRNQLVVDHLHIVGAATAQVVSRITHVSRDDLASAGAYALVRAAERFDASLGVPFGAFARGRINWALMDELRAMDWAPREVRSRAKRTTKVRDALTASLGRRPTVDEIAQTMGVDPAAVREGLADAERMLTSLDAPDIGEIVWTGYLPDELVIASERDELLNVAVDALPERKRYIIRAVYFQDRTVKEIADELGVSHAAVSQQRAEAVRMLRDALDRHYAEGPRAAGTTTARSSASVLDAYFERITTSGQRIARATIGRPVGV